MSLMNAFRLDEPGVAVGRQGAGQNAVRSKDSDTFYTFLRTLRAALGPNKIIGASMPASGCVQDFKAATL